MSLEQDLDPYNLTRYESATVASATTQQPDQPLSSSQLTLAPLEASPEFELSDRIVSASAPLDLNATETVTVQQNTGLFLNKEEEQTWRGLVKLSEYPINVDKNPEVVIKPLNQTINYTQSVQVRYIKPPTPPKTGEIIIREEPDLRVPKAPPVIIRQRAPEPVEPAPLVLREQPPTAPREIEKKCISISGKRMPPPPRRLIIEQMPTIPMRPQQILVERWLPYEEQTRNVKFLRAAKVSNWEPERNLVIKWDSPRVTVTKEVRTLETVPGNPEEYRRLYGDSLLSPSQLSSTLKSLNIALPQTFERVGEVQRVARLEGDLDALRLVDLDRWGLSEYKYLLKESGSGGVVGEVVVGDVGDVWNDVWSQAKVESGRIRPDEARRLLILVHQKLEKVVDEGRVNRFVSDVTDKDGWIEFEMYKKLVVNWIVL